MRCLFLNEHCKITIAHSNNGDHVHDWGRPADGSAPTNADRGLGRLPQLGDPPAPWGVTP